MIELRAFGGLRLRNSADGHEILSVLARAKPSGLLVYLALSPLDVSCSRDKLFALLWPGSNTEKARNSLSQALHTLRSGLGPGVIGTTEDGELFLEAGAVWCDVAAFDEALASGDTREALELYRGHLWDASDLSDCLNFEHWLDGERRRLRSRAVAAAVTLAQELEQDGSFVDAAQWLQRARDWAPYEEAVVRPLLELLHGLGERAAAVREYDAYKKRLAAELQLEPSADVRRLIKEIRAERPPTERLGPGESLAATAGEADVDAPTPRRRRETVQVVGTQSRRPRWGWLVALGIAVPTLFIGLRAIGIPDPTPVDFSIADLPLWFTELGFEGPDTTPGAPALTAWITFAGSRSIAAAGAGRDFGRLKWTGRLPSDPYGVAVTPDGRFAYVGLAGPRPGFVVIDTRSFEWSDIATDELHRRSAFTSLAVTPNGAFVYVLDVGMNEVVVLETDGNRVTEVIRLPGRGPIVQAGGGSNLLITPDGARVYVTGYQITVIETETNSVVRSIHLEAVTEGQGRIDGIAITKDERIAYVTHKGLISVIDLETEEVINTIATESGTRLFDAIAISPDGSVVYANTCCRKLLVISTATNTVVDSVPVFAGGGAGTFTPDGAFAWVANSNATRITVINTTTLKRNYTSSIPGRFPVGITLVPNNP